jgi:hypothetical protein
MAMHQIVRGKSHVAIDGVARRVDTRGIPANIAAIHFDSVANVGWIEFAGDAFEDVKPPQKITSLAAVPGAQAAVTAWSTAPPF